MSRLRHMSLPVNSSLPLLPFPSFLHSYLPTFLPSFPYLDQSVDGNLLEMPPSLPCLPFLLPSFLPSFLPTYLPPFRPPPPLDQPADCGWEDITFFLPEFVPANLLSSVLPFLPSYLPSFPSFRSICGWEDILRRCPCRQVD